MIINFEGDRPKDGRIHARVKYAQMCRVSVPHGIPGTRLRLSYESFCTVPSAVQKKNRTISDPVILDQTGYPYISVMFNALL